MKRNATREWLASAIGQICRTACAAARTPPGHRV